MASNKFKKWDYAESELLLSLLYVWDGSEIARSQLSLAQAGEHMAQFVKELGINGRDYTRIVVRDRYDILQARYSKQTIGNVLESLAQGNGYGKHLAVAMVSQDEPDNRESRSVPAEASEHASQSDGMQRRRDPRRIDARRQFQAEPDIASSKSVFAKILRIVPPTVFEKTTFSYWTSAEDELLLSLIYSWDGSRVTRSELGFHEITKVMSKRATELGINKRPYTYSTVYGRSFTMPKSHQGQVARNVLKSLAQGNDYGTYLDSIEADQGEHSSLEPKSGFKKVIESGSPKETNEERVNNRQQSEEGHNFPDLTSISMNTTEPATQEHRSADGMSKLWTSAEDELLLSLMYVWDGSQVIRSRLGVHDIGEIMSERAVELGLKKRFYTYSSISRRHAAMPIEYRLQTTRKALERMAERDRSREVLASQHPGPSQNSQSGSPNISGDNLRQTARNALEMMSQRGKPQETLTSRHAGPSQDSQSGSAAMPTDNLRQTARTALEMMARRNRLRGAPTLQRAGPSPQLQSGSASSTAVEPATQPTGSPEGFDQYSIQGGKKV